MRLILIAFAIAYPAYLACVDRGDVLEYAVGELAAGPAALHGGRREFMAPGIRRPRSGPDPVRIGPDSLVHGAGRARSLTASGLEVIRARHTCAHRVDQLLAFLRET